MSAAAPTATPGIAGINVAAAAAAIENAGGLAPLLSGEATPATGTATTPQGSEQGTTGQVRDSVTGRWVSPGQEVTQPQAGQPAPVTTQTPTETEAFTSLDPTTLSPELHDSYRSMQADYTRKTQEIAAQRKLFEQLGGTEQITEAARLYQSLQNPAYWPQLYAELADGMEQLGLTPQEAQAAASQEVTRQQNAPVGSSGFQPQGGEQIDWQDPELAPLKAMFDSLDSKISGMQQTFNERQEAEKQERLQQAIVGEYQRQENLIRQMNPGYTDDDLGAIYELSSFHQGNLLEAQTRYEEIAQSRLSRFLAQKESAVGNAGVQPVAGGATLSAQPQKFGSLDDAHVAAMESLRQMEALEQ